jgi:murein DD-endopeptidase MepM/ murein hydrolase activator NlpD
LPTIRSDPETYEVQTGDTLGEIAQNFGVPLEKIVQENNILDPNILEIGQVLNIPPPSPDKIGSGFKIIPDSELIAGPFTAQFNVEPFVNQKNGYLAQYWEEVDGQTISGSQIIARVAREFSVNPRLLLAVLEYQSEWVTKGKPKDRTLEYPIGWQDPWRDGLYRQLAWAANQLNRGYYLWRVNGAAAWILADGKIVPINPTINAGTAGVQNLFAQLYGRNRWNKAINKNGLIATFNELFGYPFDYAFEPVLPPNLIQPALQLPFESGVEWAYTGGPHGGWGDGSAWAALDFAPPGEALGCITSNDWIVAMTDGLIIRSENGAVVQDLDGDGFEQTGWTILYMHVESRDRVETGEYIRTGTRIGHPSCEGGVSTGTHLHIARRYNGEWIPADQNIPFALDGWVSIGTGIEYDGSLQRGGRSVEAWNGRSPENSIKR